MALHSLCLNSERDHFNWHYSLRVTYHALFWRPVTSQPLALYSEKRMLSMIMLCYIRRTC